MRAFLKPTWLSLGVICVLIGCKDDGSDIQDSIGSTGVGGSLSANSVTSSGSGGNWSANTGTTAGAGDNFSASGGTSSGSPSSTESGVGGNAATKHTGQFVLASVQPEGAHVLAFFSTLTSFTDCPKQTFGDCTFTPNCTENTEENPESAGTLTVTASKPVINLTIEPNSENSYPQSGISYFSGGETVHLAASGGTVPSFFVDLTVPFALLVSSPTPDAKGVITATTSSDLALRYSRGTTGVMLYVQTASSNGLLSCLAASETGTMTIPAGALAALGAGSKFDLLTLSERDLTAGDFTIATGIFMNTATTDKTKVVSVMVN